VSCLPFLVLGMGAALAHMLRGDAYNLAQAYGPGQALDSADHGNAGSDPAAGVSCHRLAEVRAAAGRLVAEGERVSRRNLRRVGLHGSNAEIGMLALMVKPQASSTNRPQPDPGDP
jgi:hypothetical protein